MDCPYCGKEMRPGSILTNRWYPDNVASNGIKMAKISFANNTPASYCPDCRKVIISIPAEEEMETVFEKFAKKQEAREQRRNEEREQKKTEKAALERNKKREESRKKDPWEV